MDVRNKATRIDLFSLRTPQMRAFHMSWFAFFLCFFAWFGIAPLLPLVRKELDLTPKQLANTMIASVAITIVARLAIGWLCDRIGPRLSYTWLLILGSIPVMSIGLANTYESFLLFRLGIGVIGASFVITQYHTSVMFAPNVVGTANATSAGWGNLGGGVTQIVMPLVLAAFIGLGFSDAISWRASMVVAGAVCFAVGIAYFFFTRDLPDGNFKELRAKGELPTKEKTKGSFLMAVKDRRVWALFVIYGGCFGIELTINGMAAVYYFDYFGLGIKTAGLAAGLFGLMNIFARTLGGFISDKFVQRGGLRGRVKWLFIALLVEGIALIFFSRMRELALAIPMMIVFSLFVQMSEGATYSVVPFINKKALGAVSGIVGAGGNLGAVAGGFLLRAHPGAWPQALLILGCCVTGIAFLAWVVRFSPAEEKTAQEELARAVKERKEAAAARPPRKPLLPNLGPALAHIRPMDALRVYLGIALVIKGIYFITNMSDVENALSGPLPEWQTFVAWCVVFAHIVGGASLALGFVTRVAAGLNAFVLLGAVGVHTFGTAAGGLFSTNVDFQLAFMVFFTLVLITWRGAGPMSLDRLLGEEKAIHEEPIRFA